LDFSWTAAVASSLLLAASWQCLAVTFYGLIFYPPIEDIYEKSREPETCAARWDERGQLTFPLDLWKVPYIIEALGFSENAL
jgi:hypothetical protein